MYNQVLEIVIRNNVTKRGRYVSMPITVQWSCNERSKYMHPTL